MLFAGQTNDVFHNEKVEWASEVKSADDTSKSLRQRRTDIIDALIDISLAEALARRATDYPEGVEWLPVQTIEVGDRDRRQVPYFRDRGVGTVVIIRRDAVALPIQGEADVEPRLFESKIQPAGTAEKTEEALLRFLK